MRSEFEPIPLDLIRRYEPKNHWLRHNSDTHGVGHLTRVFILQELIAQQLTKQEITVHREVLRWAAATHDVGRIDDGVDLDHGKRSTEWIVANLASKLSKEVLHKVTYAVTWHVPPDSTAPKMTTELMVLKDADALDRVRIGDLNPDYLRTEAARGMVDLAQDLFTLSLKVDLESVFESVVRAAEQLGLIVD